MPLYQIAALLMILGTSIQIRAAEYYGEFDGNPDGIFVPDADRPLFRLNKPLTYTDPNGLEWTAPSGEVVDGASIPQFAWSIVGGPFSGNYLRAAIIHDYFSCSKNRDYGDTHKTFWRGLRRDGLGVVKAYAMWAAVRAFGPDYWTVDPAATPPVPCNGGNSVLLGKNDQTIGIAAGKFVAISRTLESTAGSVLDVVAGVPIFTGTEEADNHLDYLREAAQIGFDAPREKLGLFSSVSAGDLQLLSAKFPNDVGFLIWDLESLPELEKFYTDEIRAEYNFHKAKQISLSTPVKNIYQEAFWMPALKALYLPTPENKQ